MKEKVISFMSDGESYSFRISSLLRRTLEKEYGDVHSISFTVRSILDIMTGYNIPTYIEENVIKYNINLTDVIEMTLIKFLRLKGGNIYSDF